MKKTTLNLPSATTPLAHLLPQQVLSGRPSRDDIFLEKLRAVIRLRLIKKDFCVNCLAESMHLSVSQLNRKLNTLLGRPAGKLIRELRLRYSARLLASNTGTISEIAHQAGFSDQAHFCRSFKKLFHCTPSQYQKRHRSIDLAQFFN